MPEPVRLIKKYPNRRLYDTRTSTYITLDDVKSLVLARLDFKVVHAKTGDDLTRSVLLQIIVDEESTGVPLLTTEFLAPLIRLYGHPMQGRLGEYLETNIKLFSEPQKTLPARSDSLSGVVLEDSIEPNKALM